MANQKRAADRSHELRLQCNVCPSPGTKRAGWLLFLRDGTLFAQGFNTATLKLEGETLPVAESGIHGTLARTRTSPLSETGVLVYGHESSEANRLILVSRDGKQFPVSAPPGAYRQPRLSPDGTRLAVAHAEAQSGNMDIWVIDLVREIPSRFTSDPASDVFPGRRTANRSRLVPIGKAPWGSTGSQQTAPVRRSLSQAQSGRG
jgi:hypothetical protein